MSSAKDLAAGGPLLAEARPRRVLASVGRLLTGTPEIGIIVAVLVAFVVFSSINSNFSSVAELQDLGIDLAGFAILAVGESLTIITGGIDLSVGSLTAFFVVASAWLNVSAHLPIWLTFAITLTGGALWGLWHGFLITRFNIAPFVATLVTFIFAAGADEALAPSPIPITSQTFLDIVGKNVAGIPIAVLILLVVGVAGWFFLERTYFGRQIYAVGGNREAARLAGIPVNRRIKTTYVVSGLCASIVGCIVASHLTSGTADSVSGWELIAIAAAVIGGVSLSGGTGRMVGVLAGAALLVVLRDGLVAINVNAYYQSMVVGVVLLVAILIDRLRVMRAERASRPARTALSESSESSESGEGSA